MSVTATIEITSATLVGPGASAWVGVSTVNAWGTGDWCGEQAIGDADPGRVVTITCTLDDVRSGDVVAAYASAWSSDTVLYLMGSVQASYSTANVDVVVREIVVSGSDLW